MSAPTNFDDIEHQKENIEPIREGRSAASLAKTFAQNPLEARSSQSATRQQFESAILESGELDDPIEPYLDYIKWIHQEYPQGNNSESGLLQLLEKCTSDFRDAPFYKDDSRYLRVWMEYLKYSDAPREIFAYLNRKNIGKGLALFYEEYAALLESLGRKAQADEVYQLGIEANARPVERLKRRYNEFQERLAANPPDPNEPSSPALPTVRPALAQKGGTSVEDQQDDSERPAKKLQVFTDTEGSTSAAPNSSGGWDSIGTLASRRKENTVEAKPWVGEKMKQKSDAQSSTRSLSVFRDAPAGSAAPGKRAENIALAMEFINVDGEEFCLEEILAKSRRIYHNTYPRPDDSVQQQGTDSTVPLKGGDSPVKAPRSPTMTLHTKAATDEVYEMFNQPLNDDDDSDNGYNDTENFTVTRQYDDDIDQYEGMNNVVTQTNELTINEQSNDNDYPQTPARDNNVKLAYSMPAMTPIAEATETFTHKMKQATLLYQHPLVDYSILNPAEQQLQIDILKKVDPTIESYNGYNRIDEDFGQEEAIKRSLKRGESPTIQLLAEKFRIIKTLGCGGYGSVYLAESELGDLKALKVQREMNPWEFYILRSVNSRLVDSRDRRSIAKCNSLYVYNDETWMVLDYSSQGTILDLVNLIGSKNEGNCGVEECLVMFFSIELLRVMGSIHSTGVLHCDIKPDNLMLRLDQVADQDWSKYYSRNGSNSWTSKGLTFIDFGRASDMTVLKPNVQFKADWKMDDQDCAEMRLGKTWTYQADYYGAAATIHLMLFGKYIKTCSDSDGMYRLNSTFKRYWQKDLWEELFNVLLNPEFHGTLPIMSVLEACRAKLEERLEQICEGNGTSLKTSLRDLETELCSNLRK